MQDDCEAEAKFKEMKDAYYVLSDSKKRQQYDHMREQCEEDIRMGNEWRENEDYDLLISYKPRILYI